MTRKITKYEIKIKHASKYGSKRAHRERHPNECIVTNCTNDIVNSEVDLFCEEHQPTHQRLKE